MNNKINDALDRISNKIAEINTKTKAINEKLDGLIKALHDYDDDLSNEPQHGPCSKHDEASWDEVRMDIIGQNGNEGLHYNVDEYVEGTTEDQFDDYGKRVIIEKSWMDEYKSEYDKLLKSGMMFEFHPTWTGEWHKDKFAFTHEHKFSNKKKAPYPAKHTAAKVVGEDKDKSNNSAKYISEFEKRNGVSKPLVEGKNKSQHKQGTGKTQAAPPPKPPKTK